jgi:hypothetical protein
MNSVLQGCSNLIFIKMNNSNYNSVNKVIAQLPTRTSNSPGTIDITGINNINRVNITTAESKYWIITYDPTSIRIRQIYLGDIDVSNLYIGEVRVKKVYLGEALVYENK